MRTLIFLVTLLLCLIGTGMVKGQVLDRKISVQYENATIEDVLKDLSKKHKINFSYSNNIVPLKKRINLIVSGKSLSYVLKEVFKGTDISYEAIGSQIVLKKAPKKTSQVTEKIVPPSVQDAAPVSEDTIADKDEEVMEEKPYVEEQLYATQDTVMFFPEAETYEKMPLADTLDKVSLRKQYQAEKRRLRQKYNTKMDSLDKTGDQTSKEKLKDQFKRVSDDLKSKIQALQDSLSTLQIPKVIPLHKRDSTAAIKDSADAEIKGNQEESDSSKYEHRPAQVTFVTPIGTNGIEGGQIVNHLSFNILAGAAAGLEGFEFGGLVNVEKDYVQGFQFAGLGNVVEQKVSGGQFSGLFNINGGYTHGAQFSGFMNIVSDSAYAFQGAGFMNMVSDKFQGFQAAGFTNIVSGSVDGGQAAGFLNVATGNMDGAQLAGFMNIADSVDGAQVAGFLNVARKVKGSQIGFINVADTVTGVQIGFVSFGGYRKLEIYGGETFYGNIAFKTGSSHFYNIFTAGIRPEGSGLTWGLGYGVGTELKLSRKAVVNIDIIGHSIQKGRIDFEEFNLLAQFRPTFGYLITPKTSIFAGPVFNVLITDHYNFATGEYGSSLTPGWELYNVTEDRVNVSMWIGLNAGIRF